MDDLARRRALQGRRVAVTGHRGFIGAHLVRDLQAAGARVSAIEGDVTTASTWHAEFEVLFHLAAVMGERFSEKPGFGFSVNVGGTIQALEACRTNGADLVFPSTCGVYDPRLSGAVSEEADARPATPYGQSKLAAEAICQSYAEHFNVRCRVLRLFNVYGRGQNPGFLIPYLVSSALGGSNVQLRNPESRRDFVHVSDVVSALVAAGANPARFSILNIGQGQTLAVRDVVEAVGRILGRNVSWRQAGGQFDPQPAVYADTRKAKNELGWVPLMDFEKGLRSMVELLS